MGDLGPVLPPANPPCGHPRKVDMREVVIRDLLTGWMPMDMLPMIAAQEHGLDYLSSGVMTGPGPRAAAVREAGRRGSRRETTPAQRAS